MAGKRPQIGPNCLELAGGICLRGCIQQLEIIFDEG